MDVNPNFFENLSYLLGGIVIAGILAAISQIINLRNISRGMQFYVKMRREDDDERKK